MLHGHHMKKRLTKNKSDIYFVYNHNWIDDAGKYKTASILGASKITYTHRF